MFICNHCPYLKAVIARIVRDWMTFAALGIERRRHQLERRRRNTPKTRLRTCGGSPRPHRFSFPYLYDESQEVARAYDAVCTPDFFGFNADLELQYRGRLDASRKEAAPGDVRRDLFEAMQANCQDRPRPARADPIDRLLHQMESAARVAGRGPLTSA